MSVGGERVVLKALSDLGFAQHLKTASLSLKNRRLVHSMIVARLRGSPFPGQKSDNIHYRTLGFLPGINLISIGFAV